MRRSPTTICCRTNTPTAGTASSCARHRYGRRTTTRRCRTTCCGCTRARPNSGPGRWPRARGCTRRSRRAKCWPPQRRCSIIAAAVSGAICRTPCTRASSISTTRRRPGKAGSAATTSTTKAYWSGCRWTCSCASCRRESARSTISRAPFSAASREKWRPGSTISTTSFKRWMACSRTIGRRTCAPASTAMVPPRRWMGWRAPVGSWSTTKPPTWPSPMPKATGNTTTSAIRWGCRSRAKKARSTTYCGKVRLIVRGWPRTCAWSRYRAWPTTPSV